MIRHFFNKHKFIRVISFNNDKSSSVTYYRSERFKPKYLVHPDHVFFSRGYRTIVIKEKGIETINPLDFNSKYDAEKFTTAINTKLIEETFINLKSNKIDLSQVLLFTSLLVNLIVLYFLLKSQGIF